MVGVGRSEQQEVQPGHCICMPVWEEGYADYYDEKSNSSILLGVRIRIMPRTRYILEKQHEQSCNTKGS